MKKIIITTLYLVLGTSWINSQTLTQTVKGKITDQTTSEELYGATISIVGTNPMVGTSTSFDGTYALENVPIGRHSFEFRMIGYESRIVSDILISSGKEAVINVSINGDMTNLDNVVISYKSDKLKSINKMAAVSSRQFTVEETQRYAGGLNDPARLASSFAGVASPSVSSNGISVRGNTPSGLLWSIEGIEVPSPNHFNGLEMAGAGALTVLNSQMLTNSDFYTGAFPAEYGNATSGVFDINLRSGNSTKHEHSAQVGILGVDLSTEGPLKNNKEANYLINYRYSSLALISPLLPSDAGILKYQDVSFKVNMPTKSMGHFSLWGLGAYDGIDVEESDSSEITESEEIILSQTRMNMFATGLNHKLALNSKTILKSSVAISGNGMSFKENYLDDPKEQRGLSAAKQSDIRMTWQSGLTTYLNEHHYNKTGINIHRIGYNLSLDKSESMQSRPVNILDESGHTYLMQFYTQSKIDLTSRLTFNAGFHSQYFKLNENITFEPRLSAEYKLNERNSIALAYGLHSKIETLPLYFMKNSSGIETNRDLKLMKSNHYVLSYKSNLSDNLSISIEPYFQYLTNVPVSDSGYLSTLIVQNNVFFNESLISKGTGKNLGIDFTLNHFLENGFYYLFTASVFDSKYTANDGIERNTRLNKNYVCNIIVGKEWLVGKNKNNVFSANFRLNYMGGNRVEAIDEEKSIESQTVVYGETNGERSFTEKHNDIPIVSFTLSYRKNKPKYSSVWSLQVLNAGQSEEYSYDTFNAKTQQIEQVYNGIMVPNLSYTIEF